MDFLVPRLAKETICNMSADPGGHAKTICSNSAGRLSDVTLPSAGIANTRLSSSGEGVCDHYHPALVSAMSPVYMYPKISLQQTDEGCTPGAQVAKHR